MLQTEQVTVRVGNRELVRRVNCVVHPGELKAILGENGAGKSTLLRVLARDIFPAEGRVLLNGENIATIPSMTLARQRAVMPQFSSLDFSFLVEDVVRMGRAPFESILPPTENQRITQRALLSAGVTHLRFHSYPTLSGGEKQRVQFARVLTQIYDSRPYPDRYLLLDEPVSNLDLRHQHEVMKTLLSLSRAGVGVLIVLHDLNLASVYADRLLLMKTGRVLREGAPEDVMQSSFLEEAFSYPVSVTKHPNLNRPFVVPFVQNDWCHESDPQNLNQKQSYNPEGEEQPCFKMNPPRKSSVI